MITTRQLFNLIQTNSNLYLLPCKLDPDELARLLGDRIVQTSGKNYAIAMHRDDPTDCSDRTEYFDWHSDGFYHARPPRFVLLHCLHPGNGHCNTEFANVETLLDSISEDSLYTLRSLRSHYIGHGGCFVHPISIGREMLLASRGYVSPLPDLPLENTPSIRDITSAFSDLYQRLGQIAYSSKWQKGDTFVFDQYKTLHRRTSRGVDKDRKLIRMWWT